MTQDDEQRQLNAVREDLLREYSGLAPEMVNARLRAIVAEFEGAPVAASCRCWRSVDCVRSCTTPVDQALGDFVRRGSGTAPVVRRSRGPSRP